LQLDRDDLQAIDARHVCARCAGLLLPVVIVDLHQRSVLRTGGIGIVLHQRWRGRQDVCVEHDRSDLHALIHRLYDLQHLDLPRRIELFGRELPTN
jgi:hypothetical protein